jgi:hypothetical protein
MHGRDLDWLVLVRLDIQANLPSKDEEMKALPDPTSCPKCEGKRVWLSSLRNLAMCYACGFATTADDDPFTGPPDIQHDHDDGKDIVADYVDAKKR